MPEAARNEAAPDIASAPCGEVHAWVQRHDLSPDDVVRLLRRQDLTEEIVTSIVDHHPWISLHKVQVGVVNNPATPKMVAQKYVYHLYWRELVGVMSNLRVEPAVRHAAENLLEEKFGDMSLGEKIALAKIPQRGIVKAVRRMDSVDVLKALLRNPALVEEDVLFILHYPNLSGQVLDAVARSPKWRPRPAVCYGLIRHPRTPQPTALRLLASMPQKELRELASNFQVPRPLRDRARKLYIKRRAGR
ncbi:MAG: hypothetical protein JSV08_04395 [Acidobacteriota bacterium]|nr:MAG: hypothetical protein JSV08_04395 [Acidobacteriota bacterium]